MDGEKRWQEALQEYCGKAFALNYQIAGDPELSGAEYHACAAFVRECRALGMATEERFTQQPTAFRAAAWRAERPLFRAAVLAEYDALPDIGHGCGHAANGAISFLAAAALRRLGQAEGLPFDVDLIGTPDEDLHGGKVIMCRADVFKAYDVAVMVHVSANETNPNCRFLALNDFLIRFHGQTAHAAAVPWQGRNALNGAMLALHAMDMLRQHVRPETRLASCIRNGGSASNVVPDLAEIECCIRHSERPYLNQLIKRVMNCVRGAALATETTYDVEEVGCAFDDLLWNEPLTEISRSVLRDLDIPFTEPVCGGSSDIGNVSYQCPAVHLHLAMGDTYYPGHTREIAEMVQRKDVEPVIVSGADIIGRILFKLAADGAVREKVKQGFLEGTR